MRRLIPFLALAGLLVAACGGGTVTDTVTITASPTAEAAAPNSSAATEQQPVPEVTDDPSITYICETLTAVPRPPSTSNISSEAGVGETRAALRQTAAALHVAGKTLQEDSVFEVVMAGNTARQTAGRMELWERVLSRTGKDGRITADELMEIDEYEGDAQEAWITLKDDCDF